MSPAQVVINPKLDTTNTICGYSIISVNVKGSNGKVSQALPTALDRQIVDAAFDAVRQYGLRLPIADSTPPKHDAGDSCMTLNWPMHVSLCNDLLSRPQRLLQEFHKCIGYEGAALQKNEETARHDFVTSAHGCCACAVHCAGLAPASASAYEPYT
jgi:hypothetical protein